MQQNICNRPSRILSAKSQADTRSLWDIQLVGDGSNSVQNLIVIYVDCAMYSQSQSERCPSLH